MTVRVLFYKKGVIGWVELRGLKTLGSPLLVPAATYKVGAASRRAQQVAHPVIYNGVNMGYAIFFCGWVLGIVTAHLIYILAGQHND